MDLFTVRVHSHTSPCPYLYLLALNFQGSNSEVHSDGVLLPFHVIAQFETLDNAGLANIRVPNQDDLKKIVKGLFGPGTCGLHSWPITATEKASAKLVTGFIYADVEPPDKN